MAHPPLVSVRTLFSRWLFKLPGQRNDDFIRQQFENSGERSVSAINVASFFGLLSRVTFL
jgi:hypothetical protein